MPVGSFEATIGCSGAPTTAVGQPHGDGIGWRWFSAGYWRMPGGAGEWLAVVVVGEAREVISATSVALLSMECASRLAGLQEAGVAIR